MEDTHTCKATNLTVDPPLTIECRKPQFTQKWALVSFVSPEDNIKKRFFFEANRFLYHHVNKKLISIAEMIATGINRQIETQLGRKIETYKTSQDQKYQIIANLLEEIKSELHLDEEQKNLETLKTFKFDQEEIMQEFEDYKVQNNRELEKEFNETHDNRTSIRGIKIRGVYEDIEDARAKAKELTQKVESFTHVFIAPVGYWCPFDPNPDAIGDQVYAIDKLNTLIGELKDNEKKRKELFEKRKQEMIDQTNKKNLEQLKEKIKQR